MWNWLYLVKGTCIKNLCDMQHWPTHNLTYIYWCRFSSETQIIHPKPYKQFDMSTIPAAVISNLLLSQSNIMAASVDIHSRLFSDVSPVLTTYNNHNVTTYTVLFSTGSPCWPPLSLLPKTVHLSTYSSTHNFNCITVHFYSSTINHQQMHWTSLTSAPQPLHIQPPRTVLLSLYCCLNQVYQF